MSKQAKRHRSRVSVAPAPSCTASQRVASTAISGLDVARRAESSAWYRALLHGRPSIAILCSAAALVVFSYALAIFVRADGSIEVHLPARSARVSAGRNLVAAELGPTIRASSYLGTFYQQHHPAFVVDGMVRPTKAEKWASSPGDRSPWLELQFRARANVSRVVIQHAGAVEAARYTARNYDVRCVDARVDSVVTVRNNHLPRSEHRIDCANARGIRLDFDANDSPDGIVRIYEVEAFAE